MKLATYISNLITVLVNAKSVYECETSGNCKIHLCSHSLGLKLFARRIDDCVNV